jgi:hypothetical protein
MLGTVLCGIGQQSLSSNAIMLNFVKPEQSIFVQFPCSLPFERAYLID